MMYEYYDMYNLPNKIRLFVTRWDICPRTTAERMKIWIYHPRISICYNLIKNPSSNRKQMAQHFDDFKYLLVVTSDITHFVIPIPLIEM